MRDGVHPTFFERVTGGGVDPHVIWSSPGLVDLCHPVGSPDVEPLQPRQCSLHEVSRFAAVEEHRLDNRLIEHGAHLWRSVVRLKYLPDS